MLVGVNGSGKQHQQQLAFRYKEEGSVLLAADTVRLQLINWGRADRAGVPLVAGQPGGDPGAATYDGIQSALKRESGGHC